MTLPLLALGALLQVPDPGALAIVDTALARMGGEAALQSIERVHYEMMTEWQRTSFDDRPYTDLPSYERHTDVRDYALGAWRNTRQFGARSVVDLVRDTVAVRDFGEGWTPLNVAYVDERDELFTYTPDRLVLALRAAADLRLLPDTSIDGLAHARVGATLNGAPSSVLFRRSDGLPAVLRFRAAHPNDFGLVPWGEMDVEVWYAQWRTLPNGVSVPSQWNVRRVGRPYKRLTVLSQEVNPAFAADSFAVPVPMRDQFFATANRPMHDLPVDSATITSGRLLQFHGFGLPSGAVRVGDGWLLLEAGQAPLNAERASAWLDENTDARVAGALVGLTRAANGGAATLADRGLPVYAGPGAAPFLRTVLDNHAAPATALDVIRAGRWLRFGADSLRVEPIDLPDARGALAVYVPALEWVYVSMATTPLDTSLLLGLARRNGWRVSRIGTARGIDQPIPAPAR